MSKGFVIALAAALVLTPCAAVVSAAEETQAEAKQGCDNKECCKDGKCSKDGDCCKDGKCSTDCADSKCGKDCKDSKCTEAGCSAEAKCTACKCTDCRNADCDKDNCNCAAGEAGYAVYSNGDCAEGKCCNKSCYAAGRYCSNQGCRGYADSALSIRGLSLFAASPSTSSDMAWQILADELCSVPATAYEPPTASQCVYLILDSAAGGDMAIRSDCRPGATVGSMLRDASLPHPVNFAQAEIVVQRPTGAGEPQELPVRWDQASGCPTKCTDYELQANDLLCVKLAGTTECTPCAVAAAYGQSTSPARCQGGECREAYDSAEERVAQIQYSIQIIEDSCGCMSEYESLRQGSPMMFAESKSLLPAMRILAKQQCIKQLSSPKLMCTAGQTAQLEIGSETPAEGSIKCRGLRLEVESSKFEDGLKVELAMHASEDDRKFEVRTAIVVDEGQTIVMNANAGPARHADSKQAQPAVYIVLTPELVK